MIMLPNIYGSVCVVIGFVSVAILCCIRVVRVSCKAKAIAVYDEEESAVNVAPEINLWGSERFTWSGGPDVCVGKKNHQA